MFKLPLISHATPRKGNIAREGGEGVQQGRFHNSGLHLYTHPHTHTRTHTHTHTHTHTRTHKHTHTLTHTHTHTQDSGADTERERSSSNASSSKGSLQVDGTESGTELDPDDNTASSEKDALITDKQDQ